MAQGEVYARDTELVSILHCRAMLRVAVVILPLLPGTVAMLPRNDAD